MADTTLFARVLGSNSLQDTLVNQGQSGYKSIMLNIGVSGFPEDSKAKSVATYECVGSPLVHKISNIDQAKQYYHDHTTSSIPILYRAADGEVFTSAAECLDAFRQKVYVFDYIVHSRRCDVVTAVEGPWHRAVEATGIKQPHYLWRRAGNAPQTVTDQSQLRYTHLFITIIECDSVNEEKTVVVNGVEYTVVPNSSKKQYKVLGKCKRSGQ
jgi:hypothetical protein